MGLNTRSKAFKVIFAAIAAVVIYTVAVAPANRPSQVPHVPPPVEEPEVEETPAPEVDDDEPADESELEQAARRIVQVPDTREKQNDGPSSKPPPLEAYVRTVAADAAENLGKALDGDLSAAIKVKRALSRCERVAASEPGLEATLARIQRLLSHRENNGLPVTHPFEPMSSSTVPGGILFPTLEQNVTRQTTLFGECSRMRTVFTDELRGQLDELAQNGDVMARYLYAIWPPALTFSVESVESDWEWSKKAYAYSAENLAQGEPAGLLAFGQSYSNGLFTRTNGPLGDAVMRAALRCEGGDGDARIAEAFDDQVFMAVRVQRDGYPMHQDPDIVALEKKLAELCR